MNLDEDEIVISLETFQKLLVQTGTRTTRAHPLRNGNVMLTRAEFKRLAEFYSFIGKSNAIFNIPVLFLEKTGLPMR